MLFVYLRFFDLLTYSPRLGVLTIIIKRMMDDVLSWAAVVGCVTLGVSMAFAVLMPADNSRPEFLLKPFFLPFWGLVGEVDVERFFDHFASGGDDMPTELLLPFLLFIYSFFATVVFVNLLIAQMSSTYEQVRENSERFWVFDRVTLIAEYKDNRDPFPPPFNALYILGYDVPKMLIHFSKRLCRQQVSKLYFGHARRGFSTLNSLRVASGLQQDERWHLRQYLEKHELREKAKVEQQLVDLQRGQTTLEAEQRSQFDSLNSKINNAARMWRELDDLRARMEAGGGVVRAPASPPPARRPPSPPPGGPARGRRAPVAGLRRRRLAVSLLAAQSRLPPMAPIRSVSSGADETAGEESSPPGIFSRLRRGTPPPGRGRSAARPLRRLNQNKLRRRFCAFVLFTLYASNVSGLRGRRRRRGGGGEGGGGPVAARAAARAAAGVVAAATGAAAEVAEPAAATAAAARARGGDGAAALAEPFAAVHIQRASKGSEGSRVWGGSFGVGGIGDDDLGADAHHRLPRLRPPHGIRDDRVASFVRAFPRTVDLAGLNLTKTAEWASLTGDDGGMTKGFASMILDQAICCLADLGFFSTALQVAKPPHGEDPPRVDVLELIHRTWGAHKRTMP